jgi:hypothetical protein
MLKRSMMLCSVAIGLSLSLVSAVPSGSATAQTGAEQGARRLRIVEKIEPGAKPHRPVEKDLTGYLLVYFKDETHALHFATSEDGYSFTDVNGGTPVLPGRDIAEQKGIRDPHIVRGPDNAFYMAMTDLHIFAQREGLRTTEWERPGDKYGWGNNRGLILMKSYDLIHWTHAVVRLDRLFPGYREEGAAWAPETIFDPKRGKMMVYFTTRLGAEPNHMVFAYANQAFSSLETVPAQLFNYPDGKKSAIDGDITKVGSDYHLFYVAHDGPGNIRQAVSKRLNGGYVFDPAKVDPETVAAEAPTLWRRHGTDTYVLMYDVFGAKPNNMGFSETTDFVHFRNLGRFNDEGSPMKATNFTRPKHGAVMPITMTELKRLRAYFSDRAS